MRRAAPQAGRAVRFANIAVGASWSASIGMTTNRSHREHARYVVTDLWFDPVAGERDPIAGQMVAITQLRNASPSARSSRTRVVACHAGYHYADDYLAAGARPMPMWRSRLKGPAQMADDDVEVRVMQQIIEAMLALRLGTGACIAYVIARFGIDLEDL